MDDNRKERILLVDAYGVFVRHYQANPSISTQGYHIGGVVGFLRTLQWTIRKHFVSKVYVVWEGGGSPFRRSLFSEYKNKRRPLRMNQFFEQEIDDSYASRNRQIRNILNLVNSIPICQVYVPDCEADDVIAYLGKYIHPDATKIILSSDRDFYQLLDSNTTICTVSRKKMVSDTDVLEDFSISAQNFCLARAIIGDRSDGIDGVKGAGFKTVAKRFPFLAEERDVLIDEVINFCRDQGDSKIKLYNRVLEAENLITRNWKLMYLDVGILSHTQITQIDTTVKNFTPVCDKMEFMRKIIACGMNQFDVDQFFFPLATIRW